MAVNVLSLYKTSCIFNSSLPCSSECVAMANEFLISSIISPGLFSARPVLLDLLNSDANTNLDANGVMQYIYLMASSPFHLSQWICEKSIPGKAHYRPHPFYSPSIPSQLSQLPVDICQCSTSITTHTSNFSRGKPNCVRCNHNFSSVILSDHF